MNMTHSIMFHHFHNEHHLPAQGSLSAGDFEKMLDWLARRHTILSASDYLEKFESSNLKNQEICLSFDDALLCQWDIAVPILREREIQAFFFVYSSVFTEKPDFLEIFRYFRTTSFESLENFYDQFFEEVRAADESIYWNAQETYKNIDYLAAFPFYTKSDKWFRYLRDQVLGSQNYNNLMLKFMDAKKFNVKEASEKLWISENHLKALYKEGHMVGLHSVTHPTQMSKLSREDQQLEYSKNMHHLERVLGKGSVVSMAHPCGDYNQDTLSILNDMGIKIGFRSSMSIKEIKSSLEVPRDDHANIFREMQK